MSSLDLYLSKELTELEAISLRRKLTTYDKAYISFGSNDYLGLTKDPRVIAAAKAAIDQYGAGSGASRLVTGNHPLYAELESLLAAYKGTEAALVFGSGYLANIGTISALMGKGDLIIMDKLCHACLIDGAKLSGAKILRFANNDVAACERLLKQRKHYRHCLIVTETVFSMDGTRAPITELLALANTYDAWLLTDDAHGLPAVIPAQAGIHCGGVISCGAVGSRLRGNDNWIQMGTLSKTLASYGGYVCASKTVCDYLVSQARSFIYTTALPPSAVAAAIAALRIIKAEPERALLPLHHARYFTDSLGLPPAQSAIVPLVIGDEKKALALSDALKQQGFLVTAIRPPTVPKGTARLRFTFSALHNRAEIDKLVALVREKR